MTVVASPLDDYIIIEVVVADEYCKRSQVWRLNRIEVWE
jgi:hypothetical protein